MTIYLTSDHACFNNQRIARLGMGCWAMGGPFSADGKPLGYGQIDDAESRRAIDAAISCGIRYFDTAAVYGAGHSERVLGQVLSHQPDVFISTKIGLRFDEASKTVLGTDTEAASVSAAIDASRRRLQRDRLDLVFLHVNTLPMAEASALFDALDRAVDDGRIGRYGWSTDFADNARAMADRQHFAAVQHAMNVFFSAPVMLPVIEQQGWLSINRSPLAMGLLTGKYDASSVLPADDVRSNNFDWNDAFRNGRVCAQRLAQLSAICETLRVGGRTTAQGALGWLWARSACTVPISGFRNTAQVEQNAAALALGALPANVVAELEALIDRTGEEEQRER